MSLLLLWEGGGADTEHFRVNFELDKDLRHFMLDEGAGMSKEWDQF